MKTRILLYGIAATALIAFVFLFCESPQDPRKDPENAKILSVLNFQDTVDVGVTCRCTVSLQLPELIDSIIIKKKSTTGYYTRCKITANDLLVPSFYGFTFTDLRRDTMLFIIRKQNGEKDTLFKPVLAHTLHLTLQKICVLNTCSPFSWFDTLFADTCAYNLDTIVDTTEKASWLQWPGDTIKGKIYRLVKNYIPILINPGPPPLYIYLWWRRWTIDYNDPPPPAPIRLHLCSQQGTDTLRWTVVSNSGKDTVTQSLILKRSTTCP